MSTNANTTPEAIPGRWAISGTGLSNAILLDTATGETWHVNPAGMWVRMMREQESPTGSFSVVTSARTWDTDAINPYLADLPRRATP